MVSGGKIEIKKFNGQSIELWKLKMEDLLVDKDQWITVDSCTKPTRVSDEEWKKLDRKAKSIIQLCVSNLVLLNVLGEATVKALWDELWTLYQSKSLVNKLFMRKKMYNLRMKDEDSMTEHLNAFNTKIRGIVLVTAIGSNATTLQFDEIVSSLLTEEMRRKNMESQNGDALSIRGRSQNRNKNKSSSGRSKARGRSKSLGKPVKVVYWKCGKEGHFKRDCKSKAPDKGNESTDAPSAEAKTTSDEGGDVYLASSSTHVDHEACLIDSSASFHFTSHREWFCEYEKYDGDDVFLGNDRKAKIIGCGKVPSLGKSVYYVSFIDHLSRNTWIYFLKKKSEALDRFKEFKALVENKIEKKIKVLRIDNGGEFCSKEFEEFYKKRGTARQKTTPYTP
eukprot:PITA_21243